MKFERIPIHKVDLDRQNPRITQFQSAEQSFDTNEEIERRRPVEVAARFPEEVGPELVVVRVVSPSGELIRDGVLRRPDVGQPRDGGPHSRQERKQGLDP